MSDKKDKSVRVTLVKTHDMAPLTETIFLSNFFELPYNSQFYPS